MPVLPIPAHLGCTVKGIPVCFSACQFIIWLSRNCLNHSPLVHLLYSFRNIVAVISSPASWSLRVCNLYKFFYWCLRGAWGGSRSNTHIYAPILSVLWFKRILWLIRWALWETRTCPSHSRALGHSHTGESDAEGVPCITLKRILSFWREVRGLRPARKWMMWARCRCDQGLERDKALERARKLCLKENGANENFPVGGAGCESLEKIGLISNFRLFVVLWCCNRDSYPYGYSSLSFS